MGLDMYLTRKHYVKRWDHQTPEEKPVVSVSVGGLIVPGIQLEKVSYVLERVAYWRKANAVHKWFVDKCAYGVDNCKPVRVERGDMERLVADCKSVLADHKLSNELLPTESGFFFGSTDYDEYYFSHLADTVATLEPLLAQEEPSTSRGYEYEASW